MQKLLTFFPQDFHRISTCKNTRKAFTDEGCLEFSTILALPNFLFFYVDKYISLTFIYFCLDKGVHFNCLPIVGRDIPSLASCIAKAGPDTYVFIYCLPFRGRCIASLALYILKAGRDTYAFIYCLPSGGLDTYAYVYCIDDFIYDFLKTSHDVIDVVYDIDVLVYCIDGYLWYQAKTGESICGLF